MKIRKTGMSKLKQFSWATGILPSFNKYSPYFLLFQKEMRLLIDNEIMQNEETHNHMESEMSIVIEAYLQMREKLFKATGLNISLAQREQKECVIETQFKCAASWHYSLKREHSSKTV